MFFIRVNIVLYYCLVLYHMGFDFFFFGLNLMAFWLCCVVKWL